MELFQEPCNKVIIAQRLIVAYLRFTSHTQPIDEHSGHHANIHHQKTEKASPCLVKLSALRLSHCNLRINDTILDFYL